MINSKQFYYLETNLEKLDSEHGKGFTNSFILQLKYFLSL